MKKGDTDLLRAACLGRAILEVVARVKQSFNGDLTLALVLIEIWLRCIPRTTSADGLWRSTNAYSIAVASGIPRETVRRKVKILLAKGWLRAGNNGQIFINQQTNPPVHLMFGTCQDEVLSIMQQAVTELLFE